ncbi:hypothetical protein [Methanobrevibacter sp.]
MESGCTKCEMVDASNYFSGWAINVTVVTWMAVGETYHNYQVSNGV